MLLVSSQDVGLAIQRQLGGVGRTDPTSVMQAHHLLGMLTTPDCLLGAASESAHLADWSLHPFMDRYLPNVERPGLGAIEIANGALQRGGWDTADDREPVEGHRPLP